MPTATFLFFALAGQPVEVAVSPKLGDLDGPVREQVAASVGQLAETLGHKHSPSAETKLEISIAWDGASTTDFLVTFQAGQKDNLKHVGSFVCEECSSDELLERTAAEAEPLIEELFAEPPAPTEAAPPPPSPPADSPSPAPDRRPLGGLGWGGVGSLALGVAATAAGTAFIVLGERRLPSDPTKFQDFRPAGYGLVAGGSVAIATGAVLLVLDRKRSRKTVALPFGPGVQVIGRF